MGACYTEGVKSMQGPTVSEGAYLVGATRPEMLKGHREVTHGHCDGFLATCNVDFGNPSAAMAEEKAPHAVVPTALPQLGAKDPRSRATVMRAPPRTAAQSLRSSPSTESNLFNSCSGERERGGARRRRVGLALEATVIKKVA